MLIDKVELVIEYKKNNSKNYKKVVSLMKKFSTYNVINNLHCINFDNFEDIILYKSQIERILKLTYKSKSIRILQNDTELTNYELSNFINKVKNLNYYKNYEPNLPLPFVKYETFISYAEKQSEKYYFCNCMKNGILNYSKLKGKIISQDNFKEGICHQCNKIRPEKQYLHPMYASSYFIQYYGWFEKQAFYELGIDYDDYTNYLEGTIPKDLIEPFKIYVEDLKIINNKRSELYKLENSFKHCKNVIIDYIDKNYENIDVTGPYTSYRVDFLISAYSSGELPTEDDCEEMREIKIIREKIDILKEEIQNYFKGKKELKIVKHYIENIVRKKFNYPLINEKWVSETELFNILQKLYPNEEMIRHYRPKWLEGLELDIYIPNLQLAFEYQGIQHYESVEHWGGEKKLKIQQEHDIRKSKICKKLGINLIEIKYTEILTIDNIKTIIEENL